jgi:(p)ppGpp synthase/HD superfamily hydrolase
MDVDRILKDVIRFADEAHGEQMRKYSSDRYIVHPARVMEICRDFNSSLPVLAAALLHDVLEDTSVTADELLLFLLTVMSARDAQTCLQLVIDLTDVYVKENYPGMNRKKRKEMERERMSRIQRDSQTIKYADILDNSRDIAENDPDFTMRFFTEASLAVHGMEKGDSALREIVIEFLNRTPAKKKPVKLSQVSDLPLSHYALPRIVKCLEPVRVLT